MGCGAAVVLVLSVVICARLAAAELVLDCCLDVTEKRFPLQRIDSFSLQEAGKGCNISATRFTTKSGRILCVSHPDVLPWVRSYIRHLENRKSSAQ